MVKNCPECSALNMDSDPTCRECGASLESVKAVIAKKTYLQWPTWWGLGEPTRLSKTQYFIVTIAAWILIGPAALLVGYRSTLLAFAFLVICAVIWAFWWIVGICLAGEDRPDKARGD